MTETVWCPHCDHEHECIVVSEEDGEYTEIPEFCESCGEVIVSSEPSDSREDFHADG